MIGIAGGSGSGKTTLARALVSALGDRGAMISLDRYHHPVAADEASTANFDRPEALDLSAAAADVARLATGDVAMVPVYDFATHRRLAPQGVGPASYVVVEGLFALCEPILTHVELGVYLEVPDDLRLLRRLRRDLVERGRNVTEVLDRYEQMVRPNHIAVVAPSAARADLRWTGSIESCVGEILGRLGLPDRRREASSDGLAGG